MGSGLNRFEITLALIEKTVTANSGFRFEQISCYCNQFRFFKMMVLPAEHQAVELEVAARLAALQEIVHFWISIQRRI